MMTASLIKIQTLHQMKCKRDHAPVKIRSLVEMGMETWQRNSGMVGKGKSMMGVKLGRVVDLEAARGVKIQHA